MFLQRSLCSFVLLFAAVTSSAQVANGKLQIHQIDMGQGDSAVLVTPNGEVVLFDAGRDIAKQKTCSSEIDYLDQLGVQEIDYIFVSHYHDDHIGCIPEVLDKFPLQHESYDRGSSPAKITTSFNNYVEAVGQHRKTATLDQVITLDPEEVPVTLKVIALNGTYKGGHVNAKDENDVSMSVLVSFGEFHEEIGGDLSGEQTGMYVDVETGADVEAGPLDVYKVHHHCSSHSSNENWLAATKPTVAIISTGLKNTYHHPASDCVQRLHEAAISAVYWTEEGNGERPKADDIVGGDIVVEVPANGSTYTVSHNDGETDTYQIKAQPPNNGIMGIVPAHGPADPKFAWSVKSRFYHEVNCPAVKRISKANLQTGDVPPAGKTLSSCVLATP
jgi:beta-lactamase superfamily II metal-dependent hydrolase